MRINKKLAVIVLLTATITICATATVYKVPEQHYKNLKVLPKNISSRDLQSIMVDDFENELGVNCEFCHASSKDGHSLDYASDVKPEKEIARTMMRMTIDLNQKYFKLKHPLIGSSELVVTCNTCHKGVAFPDGNAP